ncbi:MAG: DEAD/DEAH box helicase [Vicinamibacteria bacterium]
MIVAHGTWLPASGGGGFFLWGETGPSDSHRNVTRERSVHPFQAPSRQLEDDVFRALGEDGHDGARAGVEVEFLLPSASGRPVASPELLVDAPQALEKKRLAPWRITGLTIPPLAALGWLAGLPNELDDHPARVRLGEDVRFWATAARLALELLARQRFLPGLEWRDSDKSRALWAPWLDAEQERLERLVSAMPPVCRAFVPASKEMVDPEFLVNDFLANVVDDFVRQAASRLRLRPRFLDSHGAQFAASLLQGDGTLPVQEDVSQFLATELADWRKGLEDESEAPFRIAFRLDPPNEELAAEAGSVDSAGASWQLKYFLQAVDDPSVLIPLDGIWAHAGVSWRYLQRRMDRPQERVLEALGRASSLFLPIEESLKAARPDSCGLTLEQAYLFLREGALLLRESGFGVLVPSWWRSGEASIGLRLHVAAPDDPGRVSSALSLETLVKFDWQVAIGDETLDRQEFLQLVSLKQPLVHLRGRWVELREDQIEEATRVLSARAERQVMPLREVLQFGLSGRDDKLPVRGLDAEGWVGALLTQLSRAESLPLLDSPQAFHGQLRPYQVSGFSWLSFLGRWGLGACLADDMGLGKTIQMLALLLHRKGQGELKRPFLLICPTSVMSNWKKEAERFAPSLRVMIHHGLGRREGEAFARQASRHDLVVSSYSLVHRDLDRLSAVDWGGLVLDEAQNIKNPAAKQTKSVKRLGAPSRVALTGTPIENRLSELWSIMDFLNPDYLGSHSSFKSRFAVPIERYRDQEATDELRRLVRAFVLRRVKTDPTVIKDLPEKNEMKIFCSLTREQATLYEAVVRESLTRIDEADGIRRKGAVLVALTRLKQVCNHPAHYLGDRSALDERSGKLTRLSEMLEEVLAEGDHALIFTQFAEMGGMLHRHLQDALSTEVIFLHGGVPVRQREEMITRFQEEPAGPRIFVLSLKAGGFGLNLTRARHVFHFDRWWNPAVENQATDRVFRIGQTRSVAVYKFICAGTVEERIDALIEQKKELAGLVVRAGESWLTELSTSDLKELFALRRDVVQE